MTTAVLVPCLVALRTEFNELYPLRDKGSDGWIGDPAHAARTSDHNPDARGLVHAIDVDAGLGPGVTLQDFCDLLVARAKAGQERRLAYVIHNRRIASAAVGWIWRPYTGASPHTEHAHFSASHLPAREQDTTSWHLEDTPMALTDADKTWLKKEITAAAHLAAAAVWATSWKQSGTGPVKTAATMLAYAPSRSQVSEIAANVAELLARPGADTPPPGA
jgi:hypothetical protein